MVSPLWLRPSIHAGGRTSVEGSSRPVIGGERAVAPVDDQRGQHVGRIDGEGHGARNSPERHLEQSGLVGILDYAPLARDQGAGVRLDRIVAGPLLRLSDAVGVLGPRFDGKAATLVSRDIVFVEAVKEAALGGGAQATGRYRMLPPACVSPFINQSATYLNRICLGPWRDRAMLRGASGDHHVVSV